VEATSRTHTIDHGHRLGDNPKDFLIGAILYEMIHSSNRIRSVFTSLVDPMTRPQHGTMYGCYFAAIAGILESTMSLPIESRLPLGTFAGYTSQGLWLINPLMGDFGRPRWWCARRTITYIELE